MKQLTGQDIHAAFVHAVNEENKPPLVPFLSNWSQASEQLKARFMRMAEYLNLLCQHCGKGDLPLNPQSGLCVRCAIDLEAESRVSA